MPQQSLKHFLIGQWSWQRLVRSFLLIYIVFGVYVYFRADSMIFAPQPTTYRDNRQIIKIPVTPQENISAVYLPNPSATYTLLYAHGNAEDLGDIAPILELLNRWGFSVFAYDYRGYGTSDGQASVQNAYQDADAAYAYLTQQLRIPADRIIPYGRSVGGGSATYLASRYPVAGLVLESTFTSTFRVVVPFPLLPFDRFPNLQRIRQVKAPVLVMHGKQDSVIPFAHGQRLYEAVTGPKLSLWVDDADHNDFTEVAGDRQRQALQALTKLISQNRP